MGEKSEAAGSGTLWRNRDFGLWLAGTTADSLGMSVVQLAIPLAAFAIGGGATFSGLMGTLYAVVFGAVVLLGGALVDRFDRRLGMVVRALSGFALWVVLGVMLVTHTVVVWVFIVVLVLAALSAGLFGSADNAALRSIVPDRQIVAAQGPIQTRSALVQLAGAPLGGLLYGLSPSAPFFIAAACGAVLAVCAWAIRADLHPHGGARADADARARVADIPREILEGFRFCTRDATILQAVFVFMAINLATQLTLQTATLYFLDLGVPSGAIGLLFLGGTLTMLAGAIVTARVVTRFRGGPLIIVGLFAMAVSYIAMALVPTYWMVMTGFIVVGAVVPILSAVLQGYVVVRTPPEMQGRINSVLTLASLGLNAVAPVTAGLIVTAGLSQVGFAGAAGLAAIVAVITMIGGPLRSLGRAGEANG